MKKNINTAITLTPSAKQQLEDWCNRHEISRSQAIRDAIEMLISSDKPGPEPVAALDIARLDMLERLVAHLDESQLRHAHQIEALKSSIHALESAPGA